MNMTGLRGMGRLGGVLLVAGMLLAGCSSGNLSRQAAVEDRGTAVTSQSAAVPAFSAPAVAAPSPYTDRAGYYTIKPGDTLIRIGLDTGQNWRDIVRWNNIQNPNLIEVGQVLRVSGNVPMPVQPVLAGVPGVPSAVPVEEASGVVTRPVTSSTIAPTTTPAPGASAANTPKPAASAATAVVTAPVAAPAATPAAPVASAGEDEVGFIWPVSGALINGFDDNKNKGLDLNGKVGDPVVAAADGKVVYAGAGLRGYGNLIILKHNNTYLTAYAHNHVLLVKEDQSVRKGQKIAEMGSSDADRVKLHFEVRRQGKPVDPARYLPAR